MLFYHSFSKLDSDKCLICNHLFLSCEFEGNSVTLNAAKCPLEFDLLVLMAVPLLFEISASCSVKLPEVEHFRLPTHIRS